MRGLFTVVVDAVLCVAVVVENERYSVHSVSALADRRGVVGENEYLEVISAAFKVSVNGIKYLVIYLCNGEKLVVDLASVSALIGGFKMEIN